MNSLLIINPTSGQGKAAREKRRLLEFVSNMPHIQVATPDSAQDTIRLAQSAAKNGFGRVIAAGGDGTINCIVNGIGESGMPIGIIPLGTANVLAHDLAIPLNNVSAALEIIEANNVRSVDLGKAGDRHFVLMTGFGFDAEVVHSVDPIAKDIFGSMAYLGSYISQMMTYPSAHFELTFDNGPTYKADAYAVVIANCGTYAYNLQIAPQAVFDDGLLDIIIFETGPGAKFRFFGQAWEVFFQKQISDPNTTYFKSSSVIVKSNPLVKMQVDGDVCGESGLKVEVIRKALNIIAP
ncbi:MAG: diacylglycerol kinase family lipid kinase [Armatimonadetes bacterium]|nr:diacylglycerol kinase family lipid kinase [Armatimonadota bacterium]